MAVTISAAEVAVAIRAATDANEVPGPVATVLNFLVPAASAILLRHAPDAPDAIHDAALIRLAGWLYDADPTDRRLADALTVSGAAQLLAQWRTHRAGAIDGIDPAPGPSPSPSPSPTPGGNVPAPPGDGHFILTSTDGALAWVAFPVPPR